jgi:hypothetical protein
MIPELGPVVTASPPASYHISTHSATCLLRHVCKIDFLRNRKAAACSDCGFSVYGAEGRNCQIVNDNSKLLNSKWVYVSLNEFLNAPGRTIAYLSHIKLTIR